MLHKNLIYTVLMLFVMGFITASAQDEGGSYELLNDDDKNILPEEGDWALGIDALPIANFASGILFGGGGATGLFSYPQGPVIGGNDSLTYGGSQAIYGKYMTSAQTAIRARVRIGMGSQTNKQMVQDDAGGQGDQVEDQQTNSYTNVTLVGGYEFRKGGDQRFQMIYGGELALLYSSNSTSYEYGNDFGSNNQNPTTANFGGNIAGPGTRVTDNSPGGTFGAQLRGFVGVEYFFARKVSLAGEFGWGPAYATTGEGETTTETWDTNTGSATTNTGTTANGSNFSLDTDNANGSISLMFYF